MPPPLLIDLEQIDTARTTMTREQIYAMLPHRHEFMLVGGVCHVDKAASQIVTYCDLREDDWWVRGHVPGRPILPGVLMLEMAGQTSAVLGKLITGDESFVAFGGVSECKFREAVLPPARLLILCSLTDLRRRRIISNVQGIVDGKMVFEATITGLIMA